MRILYVHSTLVPPPVDQRLDRFALLSSEIDGDVLQPIWFGTAAEVEAVFGPGSYPVYTVGRFRYHWLLCSVHRGMRERFRTFWFYIRKGVELHKERKFDCIVAYSHMTTGLMAGVVKVLTGAKLVIEIVTSPDRVYITERPDPTPRDRAMKVYSDICLHLSIFLADRAHFLYANQLQPYPLLRKTPNSVFHEFVLVSHIKKNEDRERFSRYILLVGAPWFLKGADILIKAFLSLASDFPDVKLKILGFYPDHKGLDELAGGCSQIEIIQVLPHREALDMIEGATIMAAPSRCEGLSRAVLEGMAAAIPLVGSDVGGIPALVHDGENGFLVPPADPEALSRKLRELLNDSGLRRSMGEAGYARAHGELSEESYVRLFAQMIRETVSGNRG